MVSILKPTPKISFAYKQSIYKAGSVKTSIGQFPLGIPHKLSKHNLVMLSAYNPGGRLKPLGWNIRMMKRLGEYLTNHEYIMGKGSLRNVSDPF